MPVWVTGPEAPISPEQRHVYAEFVDAIAYWLWQFGSAISAVLQRHPQAAPNTPSYCGTELGAGDEPGQACEVTQGIQPLVVAETNRERGVVAVRFEKAIEDALATVDNAGERLFMREILLAIRRLTDQDVARALRDHSLA